MNRQSKESAPMKRRDFLRGMLGGTGLAAGGLIVSPATVLPGPIAQTPNSVSIKDFGAVGNGQTDDTQAIQQAIDSLSETGGLVHAPPGVYLVSDSILLRSNTGMIGSGIGVTVLKVPDSHSTDLIGLVRTPWGETTHNVMLMDITLDGNRDNQQAGEHFGFYCGVTPEQPDSDFNIRCERVETQNFTGYGFDPHEVTTRLYLINCISHHNGLDGITIDGVVEGVIRGCSSYENDRHGFNIITGSQYCVFSENAAQANRGNGFTIQNEAVNNRIMGNVSYRNGADGIYVAGVADNAIANNHVTENLEYGIRIRGCPRTMITGNRLHNNSQRANEGYNEIQIDDDGSTGSAQCLIANNHVTCSSEIRAKYGIAEAPGRENAIQMNNAVVANMASGAALSNYNIGGQDTVREANV